MLEFFKNAAKRLLAARGDELQYRFRNRTGGRHLEDDQATSSVIWRGRTNLPAAK